MGGSLKSVVKSAYDQNALGKISKELMKIRKNNHKIKQKYSENHTDECIQISKFNLKK